MIDSDYIDNGEEATQHVKKFMGDQYLYSDVGVFKAFWNNWRNCRFVEDEGESSRGMIVGLDRSLI